jgi:hypothetical protein
MILQIVLSRPVPFIYERLGEIQPYRLMISGYVGYAIFFCTLIEMR